MVCGPCQVDAEAPVTLVATDTLSGARVRHTRLLPARRPQAFVVEGLSPASHYALHFEGILDSEIRRGSFHTAPDYNANNAAASGGGGGGGGGDAEDLNTCVPSSCRRDEPTARRVVSLLFSQT